MTAINHLQASTGVRLRDSVHTDMHFHLAESRRGANNLSGGFDFGRFPIKSLYGWPIWAILSLEAFQAETSALLGSPDLPAFHNSQFQIVSIKIQPNTILGGINGSVHLPYLNFAPIGVRNADTELLSLYWNKYFNWICSLADPNLYDTSEGTMVIRRPMIIVTVKRMYSPSIINTTFAIEKLGYPEVNATPQKAQQSGESASVELDTESEVIANTELVDENCAPPSATPSAASSGCDADSSQHSHEDVTPSTILGSIDEEEDDEAKERALTLAEWTRRFDAAISFEDEDDEEFYAGVTWGQAY